MLRAWRELPQERRLAAMASVGLFLTLFLPWYQETVFANGVTSLRSASSSLTGWGAFSFVEAAVLLVAAAVLILLFVRAEGQAFHVPGGDGGVITAAGFWTCVLVVWRIFDKEGTIRHGQIAYTSGIEWGIFVALGVAAVLTYAGSRIRLAHEPEPPLPGEQELPGSGGRKRRRGWRRKGSDDARRRSTARTAYPGARHGRRRRLDPRGARPPRRRATTAEAPTRRAAAAPPPSEAPTRRVAAPPTSEAPARPDPSEAPTQRSRPRSIRDSPDPSGPVSARRSRPLDRREIRELDIAEPPTARLGRSEPAAPHGAGEPAPATPAGSAAPAASDRRRAAGDPGSSARATGPLIPTTIRRPSGWTAPTERPRERAARAGGASGRRKRAAQAQAGCGEVCGDSCAMSCQDPPRVPPRPPEPDLPQPADAVRRCPAQTRRTLRSAPVRSRG